MALTSSQVQKIADDVLSASDEILAISIMHTSGKILAAKSKESFKQAFGATRDGDKYGGSLAISSLSLANEVKGVFGEVQAIIAIYENCKMMLLPIPAYQILLGFVLHRSVNAEGYNIANKIKRLLAETVKPQ